jgi:hypothetical protein
LEPGLARDLEALFGARRVVDLIRGRALSDAFRLVDVFPAADVDFFRPEVFRVCPELFLGLFDAAPIKAPDIAPVTAPASARLKTPPVRLPARFAVSATLSRAALVDLFFLFAISYSHARNSSGFRR